MWAMLFTDMSVGWWWKSPFSGLMFQIGAVCLCASQFVISIINIQTFSSVTIVWCIRTSNAAVSFDAAFSVLLMQVCLPSGSLL
jgi:hypothetical protein